MLEGGALSSVAKTGRPLLGKSAAKTRESKHAFVGYRGMPVWSAIRKSGIWFSCKIARVSTDSRAATELWCFHLK